jgi:hypothetical protein
MLEKMCCRAVDYHVPLQSLTVDHLVTSAVMCGRLEIVLVKAMVNGICEIDLVRTTLLVDVGDTNRLIIAFVLQLLSLASEVV